MLTTKLDDVIPLSDELLVEDKCEKTTAAIHEYMVATPGECDGVY